MEVRQEWATPALAISTALHFLVDALCVCCLYLMVATSDASVFPVIFITYNILAFLSQPLTGMLSDMLHHRHWLLIGAVAFLVAGVACWSLSYALRLPSMWWFVAAFLLGTGNSLFHVWGGKQTAVQSGNDIRALGIFVCTGAFGLAVGMVFCSWTLLYALLLAICLFASGALFLQAGPQCRCAGFQCQRAGLGQATRSMGGMATAAAMGGLMVFVGMRSLVSETFASVGSSELCNVSALRVCGSFALAMGAVSMVGKMSGGWMARRMGIVPALMFMVVGVALLMGPLRTVIPTGLLGLFLVNCTMPVTLYLANVVLDGREGLAFGLLAASLMPGYLLAFI